MRKNLAKMLVFAVAMMSMTGVVSAATSQSHTVTTTIQSNLAIACAAGPISLGALTSGTYATNTDTCTVETNSSTGYAVTIESDNSLTAPSAGLGHTDLLDELEAVAANSQTASTDGFSAYTTASTNGGVGVAPVQVAAFSGATSTGVISQTGQSYVTSADEAPLGSGDTFTTTYRASAASTTQTGVFSTVVTYTSTTT